MRSACAAYGAAKKSPPRLAHDVNRGSFRVAVSIRADLARSMDHEGQGASHQRQ